MIWKRIDLKSTFIKYVFSGAFKLKLFLLVYSCVHILMVRIIRDLVQFKYVISKQMDW